MARKQIDSITIRALPRGGYNVLIDPQQGHLIDGFAFSSIAEVIKWIGTQFFGEDADPETIVT